MTENIAVELARCYLISHGAECEEINDYRFYFKYNFNNYLLGSTGYSIHVGDAPGRHAICWSKIELLHANVDETNPSFDPEKFFKPVLDTIKKKTREKSK